MRFYIEAQSNDRTLALEEKDGHELVYASDPSSKKVNEELVAIMYSMANGCTTVVHGPLPAENRKQGREFYNRRSAIDYCIREFLYD